MNRRTAMTSIAALVLSGCAGDAVLGQDGAAGVPTEAEIWANPTTHGVMPLAYIRNELMRLAAHAVHMREEVRAFGERSIGVWNGDVNGMAIALRLMGVTDNINVEWADQVVATLGKPMSELTDTHWAMWPGNNAWKAPQRAALGFGNEFNAAV